MKSPVTQNNFVVPYHVHNGVDSPRLDLTVSVSFQSLSGITKGKYAYAGATFAPTDISGTTETLTGAKLGDYVLYSYDQNLNALIMTAYVSGPDTVQVQFFNNTGVSLTLAPGNIYLSVISNP